MTEKEGLSSSYIQASSNQDLGTLVQKKVKSLIFTVYVVAWCLLKEYAKQELPKVPTTWLLINLVVQFLLVVEQDRIITGARGNYISIELDSV